MDLSPSMRSPGALKRLRLHRIVARILKHHPERRAEALERLETMRKINSHTRHLDAWESLLTGPQRDLQLALTGWTEEAAVLRETSPCGFLVPMSLRNKIWSPGRTYKADSNAGMARLLDATQRPGHSDTEASQRQVALGVFLDDLEKEHGPITSVELARAGKEMRKKSQVIRKTKTVKPKR